MILVVVVLESITEEMQPLHQPMMVTATSTATATAVTTTTTTTIIRQQHHQSLLRGKRLLFNNDIEIDEEVKYNEEHTIDIFNDHYMIGDNKNNNNNNTDNDEKGNDDTTNKQQQQRRPRIVGGQDVDVGGETNKYPWFARVIGNNNNGGNGEIVACGGSLIAPDLILSAAHCADPTIVYVGIDDLNLNVENNDTATTTTTTTLTPPMMEVQEFTRHPNYPQSYEVDYDIMMIKLATTTSTSSSPSSLMLNNNNKNTYIHLNFDNAYPEKSGDVFTMVGFGSTMGGGPEADAEAESNGSAVDESNDSNSNNPFPTVLQEASTAYIPFEECAIAKDPTTNSSYAVKEHWFCTISPDDSPLVTSTCFGDSGGPIIKHNYFDTTTNSNSNDLLVAVISGASGYCGNPYLPLWNQRISYHKEWIITNGCRMSENPPTVWNCNNNNNIDNDNNNNNDTNNGPPMIPVNNLVYNNDIDNDSDTVSNAPSIQSIPSISPIPTSIKTTMVSPITTVTTQQQQQPINTNPIPTPSLPTPTPSPSTIPSEVTPSSSTVSPTIQQPQTIINNDNGNGNGNTPTIPIIQIRPLPPDYSVRPLPPEYSYSLLEWTEEEEEIIIESNSGDEEEEEKHDKHGGTVSSLVESRHHNRPEERYIPFAEIAKTMTTATTMETENIRCSTRRNNNNNHYYVKPEERTVRVPAGVATTMTMTTTTETENKEDRNNNDYYYYEQTESGERNVFFHN